MTVKTSLIVALALTVMPALGCKKKSNTVGNAPAGSASLTPTPGSDTNPNAPNPAAASPAGSATPTVNGATGTAGIPPAAATTSDAGAGDAGTAQKNAGSAEKKK